MCPSSLPLVGSLLHKNTTQIQQYKIIRIKKYNTNIVQLRQLRKDTVLEKLPFFSALIDGLSHKNTTIQNYKNNKI